MDEYSAEWTYNAEHHINAPAYVQRMINRFYAIDYGDLIALWQYPNNGAYIVEWQSPTRTHFSYVYDYGISWAWLDAYTLGRLTLIKPFATSRRIKPGDRVVLVNNGQPHPIYAPGRVRDIHPGFTWFTARCTVSPYDTHEETLHATLINGAYILNPRHDPAYMYTLVSF